MAACIRSLRILNGFCLRDGSKDAGKLKLMRLACVIRRTLLTMSKRPVIHCAFQPGIRRHIVQRFLCNQNSGRVWQLVDRSNAPQPILMAQETQANTRTSPPSSSSSSPSRKHLGFVRNLVWRPSGRNVRPRCHANPPNAT